MSSNKIKNTMILRSSTKGQAIAAHEIIDMVPARISKRRVATKMLDKRQEMAPACDKEKVDERRNHTMILRSSMKRPEVIAARELKDVVPARVSKRRGITIISDKHEETAPADDPELFNSAMISNGQEKVVLPASVCIRRGFYNQRKADRSYVKDLRDWMSIMDFKHEENQKNFKKDKKLIVLCLYNGMKERFSKIIRSM